MCRKPIAVGIVLGLCSIAFALALLEVLTRATGIAPPPPAQYADNTRDDAILYRRRPGSVVRGRSESGEFTFEYAHNRLGFRDIDHPLAKPANTIRIVALGDSFTYGIGAATHETYLARLAVRLNERRGPHRPIEIINLGLPRHFPLLERLTLERHGLAFAPDVVLVTVLPNDVIDTYRGRAAICLTDSGYFIPCQTRAWGEASVWLYRHFALGRLVLRSLHPAPPEPPLHTMFADRGPYESAWRELEEELTRMRQHARAHGAAFVVVALPQKPPWRPEHRYHETRLARWSAAHGAVFVPVLSALQSADSSRPLYWERDGHCTPEGYDVIADAVATALIADGLVP